MAYNKVEANGETLIDLTSDTVTADTLVSGRTAHLASGERVTGTFEPVTGVKGNAESTYRKGNVNLTPANIGAATAAQGTKADSAVQTIQIGGTAQTKTSGTVNLPAYPTKSSLGLGNVDNTSDANKPISTAAQAAFDKQQAQIDYNSNQGVKNLLYTKPITVTKKGVTATLISPNKYLISGTTTLNKSTVLMINNLSTGATTSDEQYSTGNPFGIGDFIVSGKFPEGIAAQIIVAKSVPLTDSPSNYRLYTLTSTNSKQLITIDNTDKYIWFRLYYWVFTTTTYNNDEVEIMVRDASIKDDTFEPYAMSNVDLTQMANKYFDDLRSVSDKIAHEMEEISDKTPIMVVYDYDAGTVSKSFSEVMEYIKNDIPVTICRKYAITPGNSVIREYFHISDTNTNSDSIHAFGDYIIASGTGNGSVRFYELTWDSSTTLPTFTFHQITGLTIS